MTYDEYIEAIVTAAPPLSPAQLAEISALLGCEAHGGER